MNKVPTRTPLPLPKEVVRTAERPPSSFHYEATLAFKTQQKPACGTAIRKVWREHSNISSLKSVSLCLVCSASGHQEEESGRAAREQARTRSGRGWQDVGIPDETVTSNKNSAVSAFHFQDSAHSLRWVWRTRKLPAKQRKFYGH